MNTTPTLRLAHFNPDLQSKEDMKRGFIARQSLLNRLLDDLRRETVASAPQHKLIVGQRGMGKTTLLRRFSHAVEDDAELGSIWLPLIFPEEQYNIARLSDFWLNCLDALGDALEAQGQESQAEQLDAQRDALPKDESLRSTAALGLLLEQSIILHKRLILLIDNLDIVLERLSAQDWEIRRIISSEPRLLLVGATSRAIATAYEYGRAFYDFFRVHELKGLTEKETSQVLRTLSELRGQPQVAKILDTAPGRIRALHSLSGGNPRTVVLLYEVLESGFDGDARHDLERLLDLYTPLYKARFEEFAPQAQQVIDALAIHWDPMLAGDLAEATHLAVNAASAQLNRLEQLGMVEKVSLYDEKKQGFQIAERFFNIWYLMRASRRVRRRLVWLVRFMETWYDESELSEHAQTHINHAPDDGGRERHAEYSFALAQALRHAPLRTALELDGLHALIDDGKLHRLIDFSDLPPELKDKKDRMILLAELKNKVLSLQRDWQGIPPQEFWRLLGGSPFLALNEKQRIVDGLAGPSAEDLAQLWADLQRQEFELLQIYRSEKAMVYKLYQALARGDMADALDWRSAQALVTVDSHCHMLPYIAVNAYARLYNSKTRLKPEELSKIENIFQAMSEDKVLAAYGWHGLANLLQYQLRRYDEAELAYRQAIALDPQLAYSLNGLGNLLQDHKQRYDEAEQAYRQAIALNPQYVHPWNNLGDLLQYQLQRYDEAEQAYRQAIALDQRYSAPWNSLGNLLRNHLKRYDESEQAYKQAIYLDPKDAYPWFNLGSLLQLDFSRYKEAEIAYRQATSIEPEYANAWHRLAGLNFTQFKRYEEAEQAYWRVIEIDRKRYWAKRSLEFLGETLCREKEYVQAESLSRRLTETFPEDAHGWLLLADVETKQNNTEQALSDLNRWLSLKAAQDDAADGWQGLGDAMGLFRNLLQVGHVADLLNQLEQTGLDQRWRPLYEALEAVQAGTAAYLSRVAPEVRRPALDILKAIAPGLVQEEEL